MLTPVTAIQFHRPMGVGKTAPSLMTCAQDDDLWSAPVRLEVSPEGEPGNRDKRRPT